MIKACGLSKRYGDKVAVSDLTFTVEPGVVTGFLGPNGAGKSTTMRMIVGLDAPTSGEVTVNGHRYRDFEAPLHEVGLLLDGRAVHPGRTAYAHLISLAHTHGISRNRVDEVIERVGLQSAARIRAGKFSLGMSQRLGIAAALLGEPSVLILDEPVNGLDPEGVRWIRELLRELAAHGRTILLSSHLMSELELTVDHLIVIGRGRLIADLSLHEFVRRHSKNTVRVRTPLAHELAGRLAGPGVTISPDGDGTLEVEGLTTDQIGLTAAEHGIALFELAGRRVSLEDAFMELTQDDVEYRAAGQGVAA